MKAVTIDASIFSQFDNEKYSKREALLWLRTMTGSDPHAIAHKCNYRPSQTDIPTSYRCLAKRWHWSVNTVKKFLKRLVDDGFIETITDPGFLVVKVKGDTVTNTHNDTQVDTPKIPSTNCYQNKKVTRDKIPDTVIDTRVDTAPPSSPSSLPLVPPHTPPLNSYPSYPNSHTPLYPPKPSYPVEIVEFMKVYPKSGSSERAVLMAFSAAVMRTCTKPEQILEGVKRYVAYLQRSKHHSKNAVNWLNDDGWTVDWDALYQPEVTTSPIPVAMEVDDTPVLQTGCKQWIEVWNALKGKVEKGVLKSWIAKLSFDRIDGSVLCLKTEKKFVDDYIRTHYSRILSVVASSQNLAIQLNGVRL